MIFYGMRISGRSNTSDTSQVNFTGFPFAVYAEHAAAVGMNDDEFGHAMVNTAETLYFYNRKSSSWNVLFPLMRKYFN